MDSVYVAQALQTKRSVDKRRRERRQKNKILKLAVCGTGLATAIGIAQAVPTENIIPVMIFTGFFGLTLKIWMSK